MNLHKLGCPLVDEYNPNNLECICNEFSNTKTKSYTEDSSNNKVILEGELGERFYSRLSDVFGDNSYRKETFKELVSFISEQIKEAEQHGAKLAREEAIDECIAALPKTSYAETDDEQGYNDGVYDCKESLLNLKRKD